MRSFKSINNITGWLIFAIATAVYTITAEETASFWDCGEFIAVSYKLMVPHPPGAPLFLLIGRLFSFLAMGDVLQVAFWVNMVSALSSSFTILFLFWSITLIGRKLVGPVDPQTGEYSTGQLLSLMGCAAIGSLAYTFSDSFWFSAAEAEVYGLSSFFTAFVVWAMLRWELIEDQSQANKWLLLIAYMVGLSIGVHLLNLVTIPALGLIYYYRKNKSVSIPGLVVTMVISLVIIGIVMVGIIPGLPSIAGRFEVMFVNTFGLPFGSGIIFFSALCIGALAYGIIYSIKKQNVLLNTSLLALAFILIGYSSYAIIVIRSNFDPPIDENDPENVMSFVYYLKREQYGDRPLLYGRTFTSPRKEVKRGEALYTKGKEKYEIFDYKTEVSYDNEVLFPRMYSQSDDHPKLYREWVNMEEGKSPTLVDNLTYMFKYQIGHMYFRYFLWNFAGRGGDERDADFLTPFSPGKDQLPPALQDNKAYDNFYMLPLILGLIGLFFHLAKDEKSFAVVGLLFLLTGVGIVVYLNSPPVEPRERDYIYVGSFYAFAIWIGLGVLAVSEWLRKLVKSESLSPALATLLCLIVPGIMAFKGWDNHDRSGRFHSVDQARNTLASCAPNAILFTGGDNDTFPLWYVQEVEGFRTDVRVVVLSYLSTDWYIEQMKQQANLSKPLPISMGYEAYKSGKNDFVPLVENPNIKGAIDLKQYIKLVRENHPAIQAELQGGGSTASLPTRDLFLPINRQQVMSQPGLIPKGKESRVIDTMVVSMKKNASYLYKNDLVILDILATNNWVRPVYFNNTSANTTNLDIDGFLQMEGMTFRLSPVSTQQMSGDIGEVNTEVMDENMKKFQFRGFDNPNVYYDDEYRKFGANERHCYQRLAFQYFLENKDADAKRVLDTGLKNIPPTSIPFDYDYHIPDYIDTYHLLGEHKIALDMTNNLVKRVTENLDFVVGKEYSVGTPTLKDFSLIILQQLMMNYRRAEERETQAINTLKGITGVVEDPDRMKKSEEALKIYKEQFAKIEKLFQKYYPGSR